MNFRFSALIICWFLVCGAEVGGLDVRRGHLRAGTPRVLLIGDGTTLKYAPIVRAQLEDLTEVYCITGDAKSTEDA